MSFLSRLAGKRIQFFEKSAPLLWAFVVGITIAIVGELVVGVAICIAFGMVSVQSWTLEIESAPRSALLLLAISNTFIVALGGYVSARIGKRHEYRLAFAIAFALMLFLCVGGPAPASWLAMIFVFLIGIVVTSTGVAVARWQKPPSQAHDQLEDEQHQFNEMLDSVRAVLPGSVVATCESLNTHGEWEMALSHCKAHLKGYQISERAASLVAACEERFGIKFR